MNKKITLSVCLMLSTLLYAENIKVDLKEVDEINTILKQDQSINMLKEEIIHEIKADDTFFSISKKYYNSEKYYEIIAEYNNYDINFSNYLKEGEKLKIPAFDEIVKLEEKKNQKVVKNSDPKKIELFLRWDGVVSNSYKVKIKDPLINIEESLKNIVTYNDTITIKGKSEGIINKNIEIVIVDINDNRSYKYITKTDENGDWEFNNLILVMPDKKRDREFEYTINFEDRAYDKGKIIRKIPVLISILNPITDFETSDNNLKIYGHTNGLIGKDVSIKYIYKNIEKVKNFKIEEDEKFHFLINFDKEILEDEVIEFYIFNKEMKYRTKNYKIVRKIDKRIEFKNIINNQIITEKNIVEINGIAFGLKNEELNVNIKESMVSKFNQIDKIKVDDKNEFSYNLILSKENLDVEKNYFLELSNNEIKSDLITIIKKVKPEIKIFEDYKNAKKDVKETFDSKIKIEGEVKGLRNRTLQLYMRRGNSVVYVKDVYVPADGKFKIEDIDVYLNGYEIYTVLEKDTLFSISQKYYGDGKLYDHIVKLNSIDNADLISVNDQLLIDLNLKEKLANEKNYEEIYKLKFDEDLYNDLVKFDLQKESTKEVEVPVLLENELKK
jgi:LysM repeat protein